jgi:hypothetical protein
MEPLGGCERPNLLRDLLGGGCHVYDTNMA